MFDAPILLLSLEQVQNCIFEKPGYLDRDQLDGINKPHPLHSHIICLISTLPSSTCLQTTCSRLPYYSVLCTLYHCSPSNLSFTWATTPAPCAAAWNFRILRQAQTDFEAWTLTARLSNKQIP
ncbi:hypothetical protein NXS19_002053 [Fusarium pseudograminearum]|nr:hypothetical protein NXS19_002053 [Fusarium pseudograminearum]